jgi:hypothetical protein
MCVHKKLSDNSYTLVVPRLTNGSDGRRFLSSAKDYHLLSILANGSNFCRPGKADGTY